MKPPFGIRLEKRNPFGELYVSERKTIKTKLQTQSLAKSFFSINVNIEAQGT